VHDGAPISGNTKEALLDGQCVLRPPPPRPSLTNPAPHACRHVHQSCARVVSSWAEVRWFFEQAHVLCARARGGRYTTGVTCNAPGCVVATFPKPTQISSIVVASYHDGTPDGSVWDSGHGLVGAPAQRPFVLRS
jgi:hypothetical protein